MECKDYNGWTNYETWLVNLWIGEDSQEYWEERAKEICRQHEDRLDAVRELADDIRASHEEMAEEIGTIGLLVDLLSGSLQNVNWREIAEHLTEGKPLENEEEEKEEEELSVEEKLP